MNRPWLGVGFALAAMLAFSSPALATTIGTLTGSGSNADGTFSATATFDLVSPGVLDVTLENTTGGGNPWDGAISLTLTGVTFTFTGGGTITGLTTVTPTGEVNCFGVTSGDPCTPVSVGSSPYNWKWGTNSNTLVTGLYANQLHPFEIVNSNILAFDGLQSNSNHNPLLLTTTFRLSFTGTITAITGGNLFFGTDGFSVPGTCCEELPPPVPEPGSLILLGTGLIGAAAALRRRFVR